MRAVWWTEPGGPEVLVPGEAPDPTPGPGQVLIRVEIAGITFIETLVRAGRSPRPSVQPPAILGNAVGGTVIGVGEDADAELLGRQVVTGTGGSGGYAELAVAAAADLHPVPAGLGLRDAVALLADGRTAMGLHRRAAPRPGEIVLVEAAAGGLGTLLTQLAVSAGARVIAAASGVRKLDLARSLGAHLAVDYTDPDWAVQLRTAAPDGLSVAYDGVGAQVGRTAFAAMAPGGRFVQFGLAGGSPTDTSAAAQQGITVIGFAELMAIGQAAFDLTHAALAEAAAGRLRAVIGQSFPLERAADAHAAIESRQTLGKTLLTLDAAS
jgi:NADPH:quinone reductase